MRPHSGGWAPRRSKGCAYELTTQTLKSRYVVSVMDATCSWSLYRLGTLIFIIGNITKKDRNLNQKWLAL